MYLFANSHVHIFCVVRAGERQELGSLKLISETVNFQLIMQHLKTAVNVIIRKDVYTDGGVHDWMCTHMEAYTWMDVYT